MAVPSLPTSLSALVAYGIWDAQCSSTNSNSNNNMNDNAFGTSAACPGPTTTATSSSGGSGSSPGAIMPASCAFYDGLMSKLMIQIEKDEEEWLLEEERELHRRDQQQDDHQQQEEGAEEEEVEEEEEVKEEKKVEKEEEKKVREEEEEEEKKHEKEGAGEEQTGLTATATDMSPDYVALTDKAAREAYEAAMAVTDRARQDVRDAFVVAITRQVGTATAFNDKVLLISRIFNDFIVQAVNTSCCTYSRKDRHVSAFFVRTIQFLVIMLCVVF